MSDWPIEHDSEPLYPAVTVLDRAAGLRVLLLRQGHTPDHRKVGVRMPEIDWAADIKISRDLAPEALVVLIPLTGRPPDAWLKRFEEMAERSGLPRHVYALNKPDRLWIQVNVPAHGSPAGVMQVMDAVAALIGEVNTVEQSPALVKTETAIRDWWARGQR